jgi:hypothetical protein
VLAQLGAEARAAAGFGVVARADPEEPLEEALQVPGAEADPFRELGQGEALGVRLVEQAAGLLDRRDLTGGDLPGRHLAGGGHQFPCGTPARLPGVGLDLRQCRHACVHRRSPLLVSCRADPAGPQASRLSVPCASADTRGACMRAQAPG